MSYSDNLQHKLKYQQKEKMQWFEVERGTRIASLMYFLAHCLAGQKMLLLSQTIFS